MIDDEFMEVGSLVPLKDGWFWDTKLQKHFYITDNGDLFDAEHNLIRKVDES